MSEFWIAFAGGLASGVVLAVVGALIRRAFRRRSKGESFEFNLRELRPFVPIAVGFALIFIAIYLVSNGISGYLIGFGGVILMWGAIEFLS